MSLPAGVSRADLDDAVRQWKSSVGAEWVFTAEEDVALYRDAYSPFWGEEEDRVARCRALYRGRGAGGRPHRQ